MSSLSLGQAWPTWLGVSSAAEHSRKRCGPLPSHSSSFRGCYSFLLYGAPSAKLFATTAAALLSLLQPCRTSQRIVLLLTEQWWQTEYEALFQSLGVHVQHTLQIRNASCTGRFRKGNHFLGTYTAFHSWGLAGLCDGVVYMDTDLQVVSNIAWTTSSTTYAPTSGRRSSRLAPRPTITSSGPR